MTTIPVISLLLIGMLTLAFNIQPVKASGTIYIKADGSIEPSTANITSLDNVTYTFTANINDSLVVERDNIVVDGAGYTLQSIENGVSGIYLYWASTNVTVKNMEISGWWIGIQIDESGGYTIIGNNITNNMHGIGILGSGNKICKNNIVNNTFGISITGSNNTIAGNQIINNENGIFIEASSNNTFYHNNFIENTQNVNVAIGYANFWDNGFEGNYWSDYNGTDTNQDGIGDNPYIIDENNTDNYPLMGMFSDFPVSSICGYKLEKTYHVTTISNSTITSFELFPAIHLETGKWVGGGIFLYVDGPEGTKGFIRFTIPKDLLDCPEGLEYWTVYLTINGTDVTFSCNIWENSTHTFIYVPYNHSIQLVIVEGTWIVPEFPTWTSMLLILMVLTVAIAIYKRRLLKTPIQ